MSSMPMFQCCSPMTIWTNSECSLVILKTFSYIRGAAKLPLSDVLVDTFFFVEVIPSNHISPPLRFIVYNAVLDTHPSTNCITCYRMLTYKISMPTPVRFNDELEYRARHVKSTQNVHAALNLLSATTLTLIIRNMQKHST